VIRELTAVNARFAGGVITVSTSEFVGRDVVRLQVPGANPLPLFPHEARDLAAALIAHADSATAVSAKEKTPAEVQLDEGQHHHER
jgi:hypothetical protein